MQITISNIKAFVQGTARFYLYKLIAAPKHLKEQYSYRISKCKDDCIKDSRCKFCGCPPIKKAFSNESCNKGKRFPDLMNAQKWEKYKKENNITINE